VYNHEIQAGDCVTWEVALGNWSAGNLSLQPSLTFHVMQESSTYKWVSGAGAVPSDMMDDDDDEFMSDVTLVPCQAVSISPLSYLAPCPLVFFGGLHRCCEPAIGQGDASAFEVLWSGMKERRTLRFDVSNPAMEASAIRSLSDSGRGFVTLDSAGEGSPVTGCAMITPSGNRVFCTHLSSGGKSHVLDVRSDSSVLIGSLVGSPELQMTFLRFLFAASANIVSESGDAMV